MKKYRCPNCKEVFVGAQEICPKCGVKLRYANKQNDEKPVDEEATTVSNFSFNDPEVVKHEEKFVPVTSIESLDGPEDKKNSNDAQMAPLTAVGPRKIEPQGESFFDGKMIQRFGIHLWGLILFIITAGLAFPWVTCMIMRWETKHTVIQGHRLKFTGKGIQLLGRFLLWLLLIIFTLGIILLWIQIFLKRWKVSHTEFAD